MKKNLIQTVLLLTVILFPSILTAQGETPETLHSLHAKFNAPGIDYAPHVWWHWCGSNFRKEGITKDLEAMKESGVGGATIFNIASSVQNSHAPILNNPFPEQTFRSEAYWDAVRHAAKEADRLGMIIGLHGTPGYATTGGPWIPEERGMKAIVSSRTEIASQGNVEIALPRPELPDFTGYDASYTPGYKPRRASLYWDVAVMAVPNKENLSVEDVVDISRYMDNDGVLKWTVPAGKWTVYRYGYAPTMSHPHPLPDDIIGETLEVDKMSREDNIFHWRQLLDPLREHIGDYFGKSFTYVWIDSYESGYQNWTKTFRTDYIRIKGYDPVPWIAYYQYITNKDLETHFTAYTDNRFRSNLPELAAHPDLKTFCRDYDDVVNRLFIDNGFAVAREMLHQYGLKLYWEPYGGPFSSFEGTILCDLPVNEFWSGSGRVGKDRKMEEAIVRFNKRIYAAEALTGSPDLSKYTEDPAWLKHTVDGGYAAGYNLYFLHHWVHQPFDDKYQPAMGMGWWGTHFSRFQTWFKPGKAFFTYMARCQMMLQQGSYVPTDNYSAHRHTPEAEIFFVANQGKTVEKTYEFPVVDRVPELWNPYTGKISATAKYRQADEKTFIDLNLNVDESMIVVFPAKKTDYALLPETEVVSETAEDVTGTWYVTFYPKLDKQFSRRIETLTDLSKEDDPALKYFSGTARYVKNIRIAAADLKKNRRVVIDFGSLEDIAELEVNGKNVGVLWAAPYKADITPYIKAGNNQIALSVTNNWANRLIGDEQEPADFEWGNDAGEKGHAMKSFPDWFINDEPRPSQGRKAFNIWYYYRKDSALQPAGLMGPVRIIKQEITIK